MRTPAKVANLLSRVQRATRGAMDSSITDRNSYQSFCEKAATNDKVFARFRRAPVYVETLEHVNREQGAAYIDVIRRDNPDILDETPGRYHANDTLGSPLLYEYPGTGRVSPVTLRYLKVVSDLRRLFGDLSGFNIVEIGVGYGGQCRLITGYWPDVTYTLIDLAPALALANRYLTELGTGATLRFEPPNEVQARPYDLCISNYAFSELSRPVQEEYVTSVVSRSQRGYMTCNFVSDLFKIESMDRAELLALHAGSQWIDEEPRTHPKNAILVWGAANTPENRR